MQVPEEVVAAARAVYATHLPGRALLPLVNGNGDGRQGQPRTLIYAGDDLSVRLDVEPRDDGLLHLTVQLNPPLEAEVELQHPQLTLTLVARGKPPLHLAMVPAGLARLVIAGTGSAGARHWQTTWTRL